MAGIRKIHRPPVDLASFRASFWVKEGLHEFVLTPSVSDVSHCLSIEEKGDSDDRLQCA
jgi:hypothetical protein